MGGKDINIEDILVDPSLNEESVTARLDGQRIPEGTVKVEFDGLPSYSLPANGRRIVSGPEPTYETISQTVEKNLKATANPMEEALKMFDNTGLQNIRNPIVNSPSELLEGTIDPNTIIQQIMANPTNNDALIASLKREDSVNTLLNQVMQEIAEELAYLKAYRKIHFIANDDISEVSMKRVKSLQAMVTTLIEKEKLKNNNFEGKIDFSGERFEKVMEFMLGIVKETFEKSSIPEQFNDIFFIKLAQSLEGFEKKVEKIYYGTAKK